MRASNPNQRQQQQTGTAQQQQQQPMGGRMGQQQGMQEHLESYSHLGETQPVLNHDHDLIHELSERIDAVWRYDQYIANADGKPQIQQLWRDAKQQDMQLIDRIKQCVSQEVKDGCF